jgi:molybdate transport system substrate-binding protein
MPMISRAFKTIPALLVVLIFSMMLLSCGAPPKVSKEPILCLVGGTMRPAMEALAANFEKVTGEKVIFDFLDSGQLLIKIEATRKGDMYVAHDPYPAELIKKGYAVKCWSVASLTPVIVVAKGNPKKIAGLKDLAKPKLKLVLTDYKYSTLGYVLPAMAEKAGIGNKMKANVVNTTRSGGETANAVEIGTADAAVVWNAVAKLRTEKLDIVPIENEFLPQQGVDFAAGPTDEKIDLGNVRVAVATLTYSKYPAVANRFAEYCASSEGAEIWAKFGFSEPKGSVKYE